MSQILLRLVLVVVLTLVFAVVLLTGWQAFIGAGFPDAFVEAFRLLFLAMSAGLVVWLVLLVIATVRTRRALGTGSIVGYMAIAVGVNIVVILVVGIIQGGWAMLFVVFAIEAGVAALVAALLAAGLLRLLVKPRAA